MSEQFPRELWDDPAFHKGREWGRMEREAVIVAKLEELEPCECDPQSSFFCTTHWRIACIQEKQ